MVKNVNFYNNVYIIIILFILDRISKIWAIKHLILQTKKHIFLIFNLFYIKNFGIAFNLLEYYAKYYQYILIIINIIITCILIYYIYKKNPYNIEYLYILNGAIGNILDRIYYGFIIDFIDISIQNNHIIIFNISDISIMIGILIFIINKII
ncbi:Lipoprotein signal peptidase [Buchnera aphidicola (Pterocallis alni)]|uniref:signal peptidase II n=1 Tax=Buchnera aphidicola TaxID=9 RepID=UPI0034649CC7